MVRRSGQVVREQSVPEGKRDGEASETVDTDMHDGETEEEEATTDEVSLLEEVASFDEVVVWGHDALPDELEDPYVRGLREWIAFAQVVSMSVCCA